MKATGLVRRLDHLGRLVIPKEIRTALRLSVDDAVELFLDGHSVVMKRYDLAGDAHQLITDAAKRLKTVESMPKETMDALIGKFEEMEEILSQADL